jgi:hypothetical protein
MTFAPQSHDATDQSAYLGGEANGAPEGRRFSLELCEAILNALGRDDRLRREYLRRRWHGLIG